MATWNELNADVRALGTTFDIVRRKCLRQLVDRSGRNTVLLYSGWLGRPKHPGTSISDVDKICLMTVADRLDPGRGLDLVIHTPGGDTAATESIAHYLRAFFGSDIRAIVPQLALSAGTVLCCAARVVLMGRQSSLGPIDPQISERPVQAVVEESNRAGREMKEDPDREQLWRPILEQYQPTMVGECEKAIAWSREVAHDLLISSMFAGAPDADAVVDRVLHGLIDHPVTKGRPALLCRDFTGDGPRGADARRRPGPSRRGPPGPQRRAAHLHEQPPTGWSRNRTDLVHPGLSRVRATVLYPCMAFFVLVKTMDDEKVTTSRRTDDKQREGSLHDYVGGVISNPEPKKKAREEETDTSSKTGAKER